MTSARLVMPAAIMSLVASVAAPAADDLLPWQRWIERANPDQVKPLDDLMAGAWENSGGKEGSLTRSEENGPWGGPYLRFHVKIDHFNEGKYPLGWPSFQHKPPEPLDLSGWDALQYWIRCHRGFDHPATLRFILHTGGQGVVNEYIQPSPADEWVQMTRKIRDLPNIDKVTLIHFFLCENEYAHEEEMTFEVGGLRLCNLTREVSGLAPDEAGMALYVGERADTSDEAVILDEGAATLPLLMVFETGERASFGPDATLRLAFREVFSGWETSFTQPLGAELPAGEMTRVTAQADLSAANLQPGYYSVVTDLLSADGSVLGGRVGSDDLYIRAPNESMTLTVLSIRTAMSLWVRDLLHGDIMCRTDIHLPHSYDPLSEQTYADFLRVFAHTTGKHTEGNEAGDTGLLFAAEAFRKSGDMTRCKFTEGLIEDSFRHMIEKMQAPSGATITWANELVTEDGIGKSGGTQPFGHYDSNQIGEWIRPIARGIIYYSQIPEKRDYARELSAAARKAADYLVAHSLQDSDGIPGVVRHLRLNEKQDGTVEQITYHQEGRQCDVYLGRALSGLSYYAYAMQLLGEEVPAEWWEAMDNTVKWTLWKMKPNGWFDWQCGDEVEGGCHTFLGNIYIGEGLFGCYLADRQAGRDEQAQIAAQATAKAYHYVTDDCYIRGRKYEYPLEFWVGPYVYWLFTEYQDTIGPDERLEDWLETLDERWSVEREWRDFLTRESGAGMRTGTNGMLEISILGYLGIKQMGEVGQPFAYPPFP